jgi:glycerate dehydrogenase
MKIVFLDAKTVGDLAEIEEFRKFGDLKVFQTTKASDVGKRIKGAQVVITNKVVIDKKIIKSSPDLKLICVAATGTNNIDLDAAMKAGIAVRNVKGYSTESVAQHTFALLFHILNHLSFYSSYVNSKKYSKSDIFTSLDREITEIHGKVFGIIGLGAIGQRVADLAMAFGAQVVYYSTSGNHTDIRYRRVELDELLSVSDVISIHAPLNEKTKGLIGLIELKKSKNTTIILNTGRGGIVKEKDLVMALNKNMIFAAGIDVYEKEPISPTHPFYKVKEKERLVLTPHVAWSSLEARRELLSGIYKNIQGFIEEKN